MSSGVPGEEAVGAQVGIALGYGATLRVNVTDGEPMVVGEEPAATSASDWIMANLNTILLVIVILLMIKVAVSVAKRKK